MENLAIFGGEPVRKTYLPYAKQWVNEEDINKVVEVLKGDFLTTGPYVKEFEKTVASYVGAKYAVAVSNGTAALHMACAAVGISEGDEVLVSSMTFAASSNCVLYCGGTPIFVDIDEKNYNIDIKDLKSKITNKTKAIIAVDYTGQVVNLDEIMKIAKNHNLIVIEDAAHALGSEYNGEKVGSISHMTMFSTHPAKIVTTAEGGIITTNDEQLYKKMMLFRTHGITKDSSIYKEESHGPWYHEQQSLGYNYRMSDLQAGLGINQMKRVDEFVNKRRDIVKIYNEAFSNVDEVITPFQEEFSNSAWHLYVIKLNLNKLNCSKKEFFEAMLKENIGVNLHYLPVYLHPYYKDLGYKKGECEKAEDLYEKMLTLPLFPLMSEQDIKDVINAVKKICNYYRK